MKNFVIVLAVLVITSAALWITTTNETDEKMKHATHEMTLEEENAEITSQSSEDVDEVFELVEVELSRPGLVSEDQFALAGYEFVEQIGNRMVFKVADKYAPFNPLDFSSPNTGDGDYGIYKNENSLPGTAGQTIVVPRKGQIAHTDNLVYLFVGDLLEKSLYPEKYALYIYDTVDTETLVYEGQGVWRDKNYVYAVAAEGFSPILNVDGYTALNTECGYSYLGDNEKLGMSSYIDFTIMPEADPMTFEIIKSSKCGDRPGLPIAADSNTVFCGSKAQSQIERETFILDDYTIEGYQYGETECDLILDKS